MAFGMNTAYRIPDNGGAWVEPGTAPTKSIPINRLNVRSFITVLPTVIESKPDKPNW